MLSFLIRKNPFRANIDFQLACQQQQQQQQLLVTDLLCAYSALLRLVIIYYVCLLFSLLLPLTSLFNWRWWWWWANICKHLSDEGKRIEAHVDCCLFVDAAAAAITVLAN